MGDPSLRRTAPRVHRRGDLSRWPIHGHGRSPTGIVVLDGKTQLLELHDFLPFAHNEGTYKTGRRGTGKFLSSPPTPVAAMSFEWELEVE